MILAHHLLRVDGKRDQHYRRQTWRQADLASAAGLSMIAIKNIERGGVDPESIHNGRDRTRLQRITRAARSAGMRHAARSEV